MKRKYHSLPMIKQAAVQFSPMKKLTALLVLVLAFGVASARAAETTSGQALGQPLGASGVGFGIATAQSLTLAPTSLSMMFYFSRDNMLQGLVSMPGTSPFQFNVGGLFKHTIVHNQYGGLHIGGGAVLGAAKGATNVPNGAVPTTTAGGGSAFLFSMAGIAGLHFPLANTGVEFHFDGGFIISVLDGNAEVSMGGVSPLLGASVFFRL
jgi:hypothetical protein